MSTTIQQPTAIPKPARRSAEPLVRNMWAGLAIVAIWLTVLFDALFGPDFVAISSGGSDQTTIPSAVFVALFAWLATSAIAKHGLTAGDD